MMHFSKIKILPPSLKIPKAVQWFARILYFFSDKLTIYFASKLFITPFHFATPEREFGMEESSQKKTLKVTSIQKDIHVLSYGFSDKKILIAHGWSGRSTQLFMIANKLLEKGFMVISFDAPAHGKSTGKTTNLLEYIEIVKTIHKEFGPFKAAIGHSFGAMAIMNVQAEKEIFKCVITVGSGDKFSDILINFSNQLGLDTNFGQKLIHHFERKWNIRLKEFDTNEVAKKIKTPVLLVHDSIDGDVSVSCALNILHNLEKGTLFITNGLGHTKILRDKNTTQKIVDYITNSPYARIV